MGKIYKIKFREFDKDEDQILEVKTKDIKFTIEQIGRNRNIETIEYKELNRIQNEENDFLGPNGNLGV